MKNVFGSISLLASFLTLAGCEHTPPPKKPDPNAGKHHLATSDPRTWETYPLIVLVATKHHVGIDTVAQLVESFNSRFEGMGVDYEPQLPSSSKVYEEDTEPIASDAAFIAKQGQPFGLKPSEVADIISDFYLIGGSSRDFPSPQQ